MKKNIKDNIRKLEKEFDLYELKEQEHKKGALTINDLKGISNLEDLYKFNHEFISYKGNLVFIDINKRPIKGGAYRYSAKGYEFINTLNDLHISNEYSNDFQYNMALKGYVLHETYKGYDIYRYTELYTYYLVAKENKILKAYFESKKGAKMYITRLEKEMF